VITSSVILKLLVTIIRFRMFMRDRKENIPLYLSNLIVLNLLLTAVFIKGNFMYFSENNLCAYADD